MKAHVAHSDNADDDTVDIVGVAAATVRRRANGKRGYQARIQAQFKRSLLAAEVRAAFPLIYIQYLHYATGTVLILLKRRF